jgi:hypothetical protein
MAASKIDVVQLNPRADHGCIQSLTLQSLIIERLLGFCLLSFFMNFYKMIWSASLANCYFRSSCTTDIQHGNMADTFNSLSYWIPDLLAFFYWVIFLSNPLNIHLTSSARKAPSISSQRASVIQRETIDLRKSVLVMNDNPLVDLEKVDDALSFSQQPIDDDHADIDGSVNGSDINPSVPMDQFDQKRLSRPSQTSLPVGWLSQIHSEPELDNSPAFNYSNLREYRELHLTLSEMILIDKRIGIPVPTLFAGRDTFVVMSVHGLEYLDKVTALKRKSRQSSSQSPGEFSPFGSPQDDWVEISRSDCRVNEVSPNFIVSFIIPTVESIKASARIRWRFDIYNAARVDAAFRVDTAILSEQVLLSLSFLPSFLSISSQKLVGVAYVNNPEFDGHTPRQSRSSLHSQRINPDSDDEEDDNLSSSLDQSRYSVVTKHISVMEFGDNFVRLGGKLRISSCVVRPYSFVITEISGINMMLNLRKRNSLEIMTSPINEKKSMSRESMTTVQERLGKDSVMRSFVITKDEIQQQKKKLKSQEIHVGEELIESPYSFLVPIAFLKFLHTDRLAEYEVSPSHPLPLLHHLTSPSLCLSLKILCRRFNLEDVDVSYSGDNWRLGIAAVVKRDLEGMLQSISDYENTPLTFKSSSKKSDYSLRYIPINLHLHIFKMEGEPPSPSSSFSSPPESSRSSSPMKSTPIISNRVSYTCDFMTVGAFAAHSMKFKSGGLWHMMKMFDDKLSKQTKGFIPVLKNDFRLPDEVISLLLS